MLDRFKRSLLLLGLTLVLLSPACEASSLGLTVHVVPLDSNGGNTVQAHFTAIAPSPCPSLSGLCAAGEEGCLVYPTSLPFTGTKPDSGWCVRQWQKTVPSNYSATVNLGFNTEMYVSMKAGPKIRANSGRLNQPAFVALPPPLRARVNCPHHFHLSVKDLDGDRVTCRFARPDEGECLNCTHHSFIELEEETCMLTFTGKAPAGQYFIFLMAEDLIPVPKISRVTDNKPLSSVPVHLSLTVEESTSSCSAEPVATGDTPKEDAMLSVLPYQEMQFQVDFTSQLESVSEVAVVGPPELSRVGFVSVGPLSSMKMAWVRSENKLTRLLPICFAVNTKSLQSEPRCVWLYQREMTALPAGTELTCEKTEMTLVLPVGTLTGVDLAELQLNSPTCPVSYNSTHLTARISLTGCGTKTVHSGSELVYTNTLRSVRPFTMVSRKPSLILPLACRIPGAQLKGPQYQMALPSEEEVFGVLRVWVEFHPEGEGPLGDFTRTPTLRSLQPAERQRREADSTRSIDNSTSDGLSVGDRYKFMYLQVLSNCSIERAEMVVSECLESETEDFAVSYPLLSQGCTSSNSTLEVVTTQTTSKIYRLDLSTVKTQGSTMYCQCTVNLCITTLPSQKCPNLCDRSLNHRALVGSLLTRSYTVRSGAVSLVVTTAAPATTTTITTTAAATDTDTTADQTQTTTTSHGPKQASAMATEVILMTIGVLLQNIFLY